MSFDSWDWEKASAGRAEENGDGVWTGLFTEKGPEDMAETLSLEGRLGRQFASLMWYTDFSLPFPAEAAKNAWANGAVPNITWEPWFWSDNQKIHLTDINAGAWDNYISAWGAAAAAFGKPVFVRWGHEFNGDWYPWGLAKNGQDAGVYVKAYKRVHDLVEKAGAKNLIWVWCPNANSVPAQPWNNPMSAYPGDAYVDWIAIDGYDFDGNLSFSEIFSKVYSEAILNIDKPIYIGEFATGRTGKAKADWLEDMHESLATHFPGIKGIVYFSVKKERDWRLDDSPEALAAARDILSMPLYKSRPDAIPLLADQFYHDYLGYKASAKALVKVSHNNIALKLLSRDTSGALDWSGAPTLIVAGANGLSGTVKLGWDSKRLYLIADLKDKYPLTNRAINDGIWSGDCIEFCISTDPAAAPDRGYFTASDWQLGFAPADEVKGLPARSWEWSQLKSQIPGAEVQSSPSDGGYILEVSVPWAALRGFTPTAGMSLGFDLAVDDAGADGSRATQWIWNGNAQFYNSPVQWGTLTLAE